METTTENKIEFRQEDDTGLNFAAQHNGCYLRLHQYEDGRWLADVYAGPSSYSAICNGKMAAIDVTRAIANSAGFKAGFKAGQDVLRNLIHGVIGEAK